MGQSNWLIVKKKKNKRKKLKTWEAPHLINAKAE
jgi:hypothetical protein